jgi:DNA polymerase-3 subunit beta
VRLQIGAGNLQISSQTAEEGEATESLATQYVGTETEIGFNAQYLQDFLSVLGNGLVAFEFKDGNSQAQLRPSEETAYIYKYVVMPMRL